MDKEGYKEYLKSAEWKERRKYFLELANYECEECGAKKNLQVHHLSYESLGDEDIGDCEVLCRECHEDKELEKGTDLWSDDYGGY